MQSAFLCSLSHVGRGREILMREEKCNTKTMAAVWPVRNVQVFLTSLAEILCMKVYRVVVVVAIMACQRQY